MGKWEWIGELAGKLLPGRSEKKAVSDAEGLWNLRNLVIAIVVFALLIGFILYLPKLIVDWVVEENKELFCDHASLDFSIKKYDYNAMTVRYGCRGCNTKFYAPLECTETVVKETSCAEPGKLERVYTAEGLPELNKTVTEEIPMFPHTYKLLEIGYDPTCEATGLTDYTMCSVCNRHFTPEVIPAKGHTNKVLIPYKEPTCTEVGNKAKTQCTVCDKITGENFIIAKVAHKYENHSTVAPTDYTAGYDLHECIWCDASYQDNIVPAFNQTITVNGGRLVNATTTSDILVIPESHGGSAITSIQYGAVSGNASIKEIILPKTVTYISSGAFMDLPGLERITFAEGLETIETGAFRECPKISELHFPSTLKETGANCFPDSKNITKVWFDENSEPYVHNFYFSEATLSLKLPKNASTANINYALNNLPFLAEIYMTAETKAKLGESALSTFEVKTDYSEESSVIAEGSSYYAKIGDKYYFIAALGAEERLILPERINGELYSLRKGSLQRIAKHLKALTVHSAEISILDAVGTENKS